jgi:hypothetical protein
MLMSRCIVLIRVQDIYGELLDTVYLSNKYAEPISYEFWLHVRKMVDWICIHWQESDEGIWEVRGGQQHFVYSKVMSWVALDRGIRLAEKRSFPADLPRWYNVRNTIYEEIQEKGWSKKRNAFVQHYGSETLDASVLIMPLVFFMSPTDPRFVSTLDAILASVADGTTNDARAATSCFGAHVECDIVTDRRCVPPPCRLVCRGSGVEQSRVSIQRRAHAGWTRRRGRDILHLHILGHSHTHPDMHTDGAVSTDVH